MININSYYFQIPFQRHRQKLKKTFSSMASKLDEKNTENYSIVLQKIFHEY